MRKQLEIQIYSPVDYTDENIKKFMKQNKNYSFEEYNYVFQNKIYTAVAEKIIVFFAKYDNGYFTPEKCDAYEPIREIFNINDIRDPIRWLSQPGSAFYLKKRKDGILGVIENNESPPIWIDGKLIQSVRKPPYFKSYIKLFINEKAFIKKGIDYWHNFINDLSKEVKVYYAFIDYKENICHERELILLSNIEDFKVRLYQINYFDKDFLKLANINIEAFNYFRKLESEHAISFHEESIFLNTIIQ